MVEKLTARARQALEDATREAARLNHGSVSATHLVLGILKDPESLGCVALKGLGVDLDRLRDELERRAALSPAEREGQSEFSPSALRAIQLAKEAVASTGNAYVGTEHLLLGVIREETNEAAGVLGAIGIDEPRLLAEVARHIGSGNPTMASLVNAMMGDVDDTEATATGTLKCQVCGTRWATRHITEVRDGTMVERHLCGQCSQLGIE